MWEGAASVGEEELTRGGAPSTREGELAGMYGEEVCWRGEEELADVGTRSRRHGEEEELASVGEELVGGA